MNDRYDEDRHMVFKRMTAKIICFLCILLSLMGCKNEIGGTDFIDKQTTGKTDFADKQTVNKESQTEMIKINDTGDGILVDDLLECIDMLG